MTTNAAPATRKRGRPRKDATTPNKKPRLASPPAASKKSTPGSLKSSSTTVPHSYGPPSRKASATGPSGQGKTPVHRVHEVPDSEDDAPNTRPGRAKGITRSPAQKLLGDTESIYEFHGSDEEENGSARTPSRSAAKSATAARAQLSTASKSPSVTAKVYGNKIISKKPSQMPRGEAGSASSRTYGKKIIHKNGESEASEHEEDSAADDVPNTPSAVKTSTKKGTPLSTAKNGALSTLKGILTPSRRLSERNAKSVAFDEPTTKKADGEIFFADLPNKALKSKQSSGAQVRPAGKENKPVEESAASDEEEEAEEESGTVEEDDEVCAICSKPDSKPPNQILFCEGCDIAVHQKCYGVLRIPRGDWLCKDCTQKSSAGVVAAAKASEPASAAVPDIPNFEQHLRSLQRVLLDRCTGKRRIKLCGQDEAYEKTYQLVEQTVMAGEGNSMLIIGARGCGKTTVSFGGIRL